MLVAGTADIQFKHSLKGPIVSYNPNPSTPGSDNGLAKVQGLRASTRTSSHQRKTDPLEQAPGFVAFVYSEHNIPGRAKLVESPRLGLQ